MARGVRRRLAVAAVGLAAFAVSSSPAASADVGGAADALVIVDAPGGSRILGGDGHSPFSVDLPEGAACPGDSLHDYRVQSFLVPAAVDPGTIVFQGQRPGEKDGSARYWALYKVNSDTYLNQPTNRADEPGGEGVIINIPSFSFAVFDSGMVPPGRAHLGIACSLYGETVRYWSADIDVVADADDPAGIAWTVVDAPAESSGGPSNFAPIAAAVAVAAGAATVALRRRAGSRAAAPGAGR